jgi:hypothetical protein
VTIHLSPSAGGGARHFDAEIDLSEVRVPADASVFVEAYQRADFMRFDFGTVAKMVAPDHRVLTEIGSGVRPLFRVKVVSRPRPLAKILALADKVLPIDVANDEDARRTILPVEYVDLGSRIWHLDMEREWPTLCLNTRIADIREIARSDNAFHALVYPEVIRRILTEIIREDANDESLDPDDWPSLWLQFAQSLPNVTPLPGGHWGTEEQEKLAWVETAVESFAAHVKTLDKFAALHRLAEE